MILALLTLIATITGGHLVTGPTYVAVEWSGGKLDGQPCGALPDEGCYVVISWADPKPLMQWGGPTAEGLGP